MRTILAFLFVATLLGCSDDDDKITDPRDRMAGAHRCLITQYNDKGQFISQSENGSAKIKKGEDPSVIEIASAHDFQVQIEKSDGGYLLHVIPGAIDEDYSVEDNSPEDDPSFYDIEEGHFWVYYKVLYKGNLYRMVILDGEKL